MLYEAAADLQSLFVLRLAYRRWAPGGRRGRLLGLFLPPAFSALRAADPAGDTGVAGLYEAL